MGEEIRKEAFDGEECIPMDEMALSSHEATSVVRGEKDVSIKELGSEIWETPSSFSLPCRRNFPCCHRGSSCCSSPAPHHPLLPAARITSGASEIGTTVHPGLPDISPSLVVDRKESALAPESLSAIVPSREGSVSASVVDPSFGIGPEGSAFASEASTNSVVNCEGSPSAPRPVLEPVLETASKPDVFVRTFGYFDIFVDGKPVIFKSPKEKELMALLVDREGGTVTAEEAISCLWENELVCDKMKSRYRKLCQRTRKTLETQGLCGLMEESRGVRNLNRGMVTCDYYEMMEGSERYTHMFGGRYLSSYSWAEPTLGMILRVLLRRSGRGKETSSH